MRLQITLSEEDMKEALENWLWENNALPKNMELKSYAELINGDYELHIDKKEEKETSES